MTEPFEYLQRRLDPQRQWHDDKAKWNKRRFYLTETATLLAGAAIPVVNVLLVGHSFRAGVLSAALGGIVVVAAAVGKLFKFHENWLQYRGLVEALEREEELYKGNAADYAKADQPARDRLLVERAEDILASTTSQFIATHRAARASEPSKEGATQPG